MPSPHVAVVGAGIVGLAAALRLRAAGHAVTLIAPELPGRAVPAAADDASGRAAAHVVAGATHAAAGMLAPLTETQFGQDALAPLLQAGARAWPELVALLARFTDAGTGYRADGSWVVAADPSDARAWAHVLEHATSLGRRSEPVSVRVLRRSEPALAPGLHAAVDAPDDHQVDPRRTAVACLAALAAERAPDGGALPDGAGPPARMVAARVVSADPHAGRVRLGLASGQELTADAAVLAAGLGHRDIGGAAAALEVPLRPVHGDVLRLRVRPEQLLPGESHLLSRTVRGLVHGRQVYLVPRDDGTLVVGASVREDGLAGTSAGAVLDLLADAATLLPAVRECELLEVTTAARPGTPDDAPRVEPVPGAERLVVATGFHRHGILLAPWAAGRILHLLTDAPTPDALEEDA